VLVGVPGVKPGFTPVPLMRRLVGKCVLLIFSWDSRYAVGQRCYLQSAEQHAGMLNAMLTRMYGSRMHGFHKLRGSK
jgi:hypothetical protein